MTNGENQEKLEIIVERVAANRSGFIEGRWVWRVSHVWGFSSSRTQYRDVMGKGTALFRGGALRAARRFARKVRRNWAAKAIVESA